MELAANMYLPLKILALIGTGTAAYATYVYFPLFSKPASSACWRQVCCGVFFAFFAIEYGVLCTYVAPESTPARGKLHMGIFHPT
jgi:hypothetical protein